jgi:hypothetical protein
MADDIVHSQLLLNKTRAEVVSLLGEPPKAEYFKHYDLVYYLGPERSFFSIDSEWLVVKLGKDARVIEAALARD